MGGPDVKERHDLRSRLQVRNKDIKDTFRFNQNFALDHWNVFFYF